MMPRIARILYFMAFVAEGLRRHSRRSGECPRCHVHIATGQDVVDIVMRQHATIAAFQGACDFVVCFESGVHQLGGHALSLNSSFNRRDGGRVVWTSTDLASPAVVSGGTQLTNWTRCEESAHCPVGWQGVWVAELAGAGVSAEFLPTRQLWVEGARVPRTHVSPASAWTPNAQGYASSWPASFFEGWVEDQAELVWPRQTKPWTEPRCVLHGVVAQSGHWQTQLIVDPLCWEQVTRWNYGRHPATPSYVSNYPNEAPRHGEFISTPQRIFYRQPAPKNQDSTPADAWIPTQYQLMTGERLNNHEFRDLQFRHGSWRQPSMPGGYVDGQAAVSSHGGDPSGAIAVRASQSIAFDRCSFINIGTAYVVSIGDRSQHARITRSRFYDCSGGAVKLGNIDEERAVSTIESDFDDDFLVQQNTMRYISVEYAGAPAVFASYVRRTIIEQNSIEHSAYTAISLGWGWGIHVHGPQTFARDNHVRGNYMGGVMEALNDGGCVYTLGPQPDSTVTDNYCQQNHAEVVGFYYFDNGSRYFSVHDNVAYSGGAPCVYLQGCCGEPALDISVWSMWCRSVAYSRNDCGSQNCHIDGGSMHYLPGHLDWPEAAKAIIFAAGANSTVPAGALSLSRS